MSILLERGISAAEAYCHALKGVCGNLAADALYSAINQLDVLLKREVSPSAQQFQDCDTLLQSLLAEIRELGSLIPPVSMVGKVLSDPDLLVKLAVLSTLVETDLAAAELLMQEIQSCMAGNEHEAAINTIAQQLDRFDIDALQASIRVLLRHLHQAEQ